MKVNIYTLWVFLIVGYLQILTRHSVLVAYGDRRECELKEPMSKGLYLIECVQFCKEIFKGAVHKCRKIWMLRLLGKSGATKSDEFLEKIPNGTFFRKTSEKSPL